MIEQKLSALGFDKLQEKETLLYFEKKGTAEQLYIVFDRKKKKITSFDGYVIEDGEMKVVGHGVGNMNRLIGA